MHAHASTLLHHVSQMMLYALDHALFFLPVILVQIDLNFSRLKNAFPEVIWLFFRCFLEKSNLALFAPCGEPSVFALVKSSLDCRL